MTQENTQIILQIILSVLAILIPFGIKYLVNTLGKGKLIKALTTANLVKDFIIDYFKLHPELQKSLDEIMAQFKQRILLTTKLTDAELNYLWEQVSADIINALHIEIDCTTKMAFSVNSKNKKQKLLFK